MTDDRFPSPGTDTRFPTPGVDARFEDYPVDDRFPLPGTDTRFEGGFGADPAYAVYLPDDITMASPPLWPVEASIVNRDYDLDGYAFGDAGASWSRVLDSVSGKPMTDSGTSTSVLFTLGGAGEDITVSTTHLMVVHFPTIAAGTFGLLDAEINNTSFRRFSTFSNAGISAGFAGGGPPNAAALGDFSNQLVVIGFRFDVDTPGLRVSVDNGSTLVVGTSTPGGGNDFRGLLFGGAIWGGFFAPDLRIGEMYHFKRALSDSEINSRSRSLASAWQAGARP